MATLIDPDFRSRLQALSDKYALGVPKLMQDIVDALAACRAQGFDAAVTTQLHQALHAVAGSAGTFGFGALGQECRRLEQLLIPMMNDAGAFDAGWNGLAAQIGQLPSWAAVDAKAASYAPPPA